MAVINGNREGVRLLFSVAVFEHCENGGTITIRRHSKSKEIDSVTCCLPPCRLSLVLGGNRRPKEEEEEEEEEEEQEPI